MTLFILFMTAVLVLNCLVLMLLVLIQLPKKEAGAGLAFGGGATDALFGAGSGNALTKMTRYAATCFIGMVVFLSVLHSYQANSESRRLQRELQKQTGTPAPAPMPLPALGTTSAVTANPTSAVEAETKQLNITLPANPAPAATAPTPATVPPSTDAAITPAPGQTAPVTPPPANTPANPATPQP